MGLGGKFAYGEPGDVVAAAAVTITAAAVVVVAVTVLTQPHHVVLRRADGQTKYWRAGAPPWPV